MPIQAGDIKNGMTLIIENGLYVVLEFQHVKPGKGAAFLKTKLKNLRTGGIIERSFNTTERFDQAMVEKRKLAYSYSVNDIYTFMDLETYESYDFSEAQLGDQKNYLIEGAEVIVKFFEEEVLGLELPEKMELRVVDTTDAVAGNTSQTAMKDATLETGLTIRVPLFVKVDDVVVVSTSDGKYCGRA